MTARPPASPQECAIAHVTALAEGGPVDASLRVTINFHPDRLVAGRPILEAMARPGTLQPIAGALPPAPLSPAAGAVRWRFGQPISTRTSASFCYVRRAAPCAE